MHFGKTWDALAAGCSSVRVAENDVNIIKESEAEKYLGRKLCFKDSYQIELQNRVSECCLGSVSQTQRWAVQHVLHLFEPVAYGSLAWGLTQAMENKLRIAWRKMLRYVFRLHRQLKVAQASVDISCSDHILLKRSNKLNSINAYRRYISVFSLILIVC